MVEELKLAKESITRSLPANFETTYSTAATMASIYLYDLPLDYYQTLPGRIEAIQASMSSWSRSATSSPSGCWW